MALHGPRRRRVRQDVRDQVRRHRPAVRASPTVRPTPPAGTTDRRADVRRRRRDVGDRRVHDEDLRGADSGAASVPARASDKAGNVSGVHAHALRYDATAAGGDERRADPPSDANGWYNHAVPVVFGGADATSGSTPARRSPTAGRTLPRRRSPAAAATVPATSAARSASPSSTTDGACRDRRGAGRPPDHAGWFVEPIRFDVTGTDATSGLEGCPAVTNTGPDGAGSMVIAACLDRAATRRAGVRAHDYDATPPLPDQRRRGEQGTAPSR